MNLQDLDDQFLQSKINHVEFIMNHGGLTRKPPEGFDKEKAKLYGVQIAEQGGACCWECENLQNGYCPVIESEISDDKEIVCNEYIL